MQLREQQVQEILGGKEPGMSEAQRHAVWWQRKEWLPGSRPGEVGRASLCRATQAVGASWALPEATGRV